MSAFPELEGDFLQFVREAGISAEGGTFVSRRLYGDYLAVQTLDQGMDRAKDWIVAGLVSLLAPKGADVVQLSKAFAATAEPLASDPDLAATLRVVPSYGRPEFAFSCPCSNVLDDACSFGSSRCSFLRRNSPAKCVQAAPL